MAGGITVIAVVVGLLVRRWVTVEVLERHNEVAGFIYAVIGVLTVPQPCLIKGGISSKHVCSWG